MFPKKFQNHSRLINVVTIISFLKNIGLQVCLCVKLFTSYSSRRCQRKLFMQREIFIDSMSLIYYLYLFQ